MKEDGCRERFIKEALVRVSSGEPCGDTEMQEMCEVAASYMLTRLFPAAERAKEGKAADEEGLKEFGYLVWVLDREAGKAEMEGKTLGTACFEALSTRRFLEAFLFVLPLERAEELFSGACLPSFAREDMTNRRKKRGSPKAEFSGEPVAAQVYLRDDDTVAALEGMSRADERWVGDTAREAMALGAKALAGAFGPHTGVDEVTDAMDADIAVKEETERMLRKAAKEIRKGGKAV